jgi:hypothetical protein
MTRGIGDADGQSWRAEILDRLRGSCQAQVAKRAMAWPSGPSAGHAFHDAVQESLCKNRCARIAVQESLCKNLCLAQRDKSLAPILAMIDFTCAALSL